MPDKKMSLLRDMRRANADPCTGTVEFKEGSGDVMQKADCENES